MAWFNYPLRRMVVTAALLVLFAVDVSLVARAATADYSAAEQTHTLAFLEGIAAVNPSLAAIWSGTSFCAWSYVRCGSYGSTLDFQKYGSPAYTGTLKLPELADDVDGSAVIFSDIRAIGMGSRLSGSVPVSWGRLTRLERVYLNDNALTGTLPVEWSALQVMGTLRLQNNQLSGTLPGEWRFLTKLYELQLSNNTLSGSLPAAWGRMSRINTLYLNDNAFTGTLPAAWGSASSLYKLSLATNQLTGSIPDQWAAIESPYSVDLSKNSLCGCVLVKWKDSFFTTVKVDAAVSASDCATANVCDVQGSDSTGADDSADAALLTANETATLKFLRLVGAAIGGDLSSSWSGVWYCSWTGVTCGSTGLVTVALSSAALASAVQLPELTADIDGSLVDVTSFSLNGKGASATGTLPASWGRLTKLTSLQLYNNALTGPLPATWSGLAALKTLRLDNNALSGTVPAEWRLLSALSELQLSNNTLSGSLPAAWSRMSSMRRLYLINNTFTGMLPVEWRALSGLWYFYLSNNQLTGSIPAQWGDLSLSEVDLTKNSLCGCVPGKWKDSFLPTVKVDAAVSASDCATANVCDVQGSDSTGGDDSADAALLTANETATLKFLRLVGAAIGGDLSSSWSGVWYCSWTGVTCGSTGLVTVALSSAALASAVQLPELTADIDGSLVDVTSFSLNGKGASVTGTLPASWGRLTRLETLYLYNNALTGPLPATWSGLTALKTLQLNKNQLSGTLPEEWSALVKLTELQMSDCLFTGTLPAPWKAMTSLTSLYLNNNQLTGAIPSEWSSMTALRTVYLTDNGLCGCRPEAWMNLWSVYVDPAVSASTCATTNACGVETTAAPLTVEQSNTLKFLQGIAATNPSLAAIWSGTDYCKWSYVSCSSFSPSLDFSRNIVQAFTGTLTLPELADDVNGSAVIFQEIRLRSMGQRVAGTLPSSWGRLTRLQELYLDGNALTGTLPAAWSGMSALTALYLNSNQLSGELPATWAAFTAVATLYLNNNTLTGGLPMEWGTMAKLSSLYLSDNALSGTLPAAWGGMAALSTLQLDNNAIEGSLPAEWGTAGRLSELRAVNNKLSGSLPSAWSGMTRLSNLYLGGNALTGGLPAEWKDMPYLTVLNVSDNALAGTLPAAWSSMQSLSKLYLAKNQFSGSIPASWGQWTFFTADLRGNQLCGCLPEAGKNNSYFLTISVDAAVSAADCAVTNACLVLTTTTTTTEVPTTTTTTTTEVPTTTTTTTTEVPTTTTTTTEVPTTTTTTTEVPTTTTTTEVPSTTTTTTTLTPTATPTADSSSAPAPEQGSSHDVVCTVEHCLVCNSGNGTSCSECARSYRLTRTSQCVYSDAAMRVVPFSAANMWAAAVVVGATLLFSTPL